MNNQHYDLIGDIHGQHDKLTALLHKLGWAPRGKASITPKAGRSSSSATTSTAAPRFAKCSTPCVPWSRLATPWPSWATTNTTPSCYHTPDGKGGWLREHSEEKNRQVAATLRAFEGRETEWADWLEWMKRLPMFLDLGALRCVHACWDTRRIKRLNARSLTDQAFLHASATKMTPEHRAIENVLKGPEIPATDGNLFRDKEGTYRNTIRARWWDIRDGLTISDLVMPPGSMADSMKVDPWMLNRLPNYGPEEPPVFFGHYWLPADAPKAPQAPNIACLDFSGGLDGPLVAYRWDGERELTPLNFITATA
jgi:hypothetical protein